MTIKNIFIIFIVINIVTSIIGVTFFSFNSVINLQVAYFSSLFIIVGSYFGYAKNINKRVALYDTSIEEKDITDIIDDKFDLYGEINEKVDLSKEEIESIIKEEKAKINTKDSFKNTFKSVGAAGSIYRIIGYVFLVIGFFYLRNNQILEPITYLIGFLIVPFMALVINFQLKNQNFEP